MEVVPPEYRGSVEVSLIGDLESEAMELETAEQPVGAAEVMEDAITLCKEYLGPDHPAVIQASERYIQFCNYWAMQFLSNGTYSKSLELLKKAEVLTERDQVPNFKQRTGLRCDTLLNLACYYKARGKLHAALNHAERALSVEERFKESIQPARAHLTLAFLYMAVDRNAEAVEHHEQAIAILQDHLTETPALTETLVSAYYNLAANLIKIRPIDSRDGDSLLRRSLTLAQNGLGLSHALTRRVAAAVRQLPEDTTGKEL